MPDHCLLQIPDQRSCFGHTTALNIFHQFRMSAKEMQLQMTNEATDLS